MELRFGRAGAFGALGYSYLLYQLSAGHMTAQAPQPGLHWMIVYWLAATAFAIGWVDHQNLDWMRLERALDGHVFSEPDGEQTAMPLVAE